MRITLGLEIEPVSSGTEDEQSNQAKSKPAPTTKPTKKSATKSHKSADSTRATTPSAKTPFNMASKLDTAAQDVETPKAQPDPSNTNQANEEISALTTYTYDMGTNHSRGALNQVNNLVCAVKTMQSNTAKMLKARDEKIDKLGATMETLVEMVTQTIEYQDH